MSRSQREKLDKYLDQFPEERKTTGKCPTCSSEIGAIKPSEEGDVFDSCVTCPDCNELFFRVVQYNGSVASSLLPQ